MDLKFVSAEEVTKGRQTEINGDSRFGQIMLTIPQIPIDQFFEIGQTTKPNKKTGVEEVVTEANLWRKALESLAAKGGQHQSGNEFSNLRFVGGRRKGDNTPVLALRVGAPKKAPRTKKEAEAEALVEAAE